MFSKIVLSLPFLRCVFLPDISPLIGSQSQFIHRWTLNHFSFSYREFFFCRQNSISIISDPSSTGDFWFTYVFSYIDLRDFTVAVNQMDSRNCLLKRTLCHTGFKCCYFRTPYFVGSVTSCFVSYEEQNPSIVFTSSCKALVFSVSSIRKLYPGDLRRSIPSLINSIDYVLTNGRIRVTLDTEQ
jgi:hypothetical protein